MCHWRSRLGNRRAAHRLYGAPVFISGYIHDRRPVLLWNPLPFDFLNPNRPAAYVTTVGAPSRTASILAVYLLRFLAEFSGCAAGAPAWACRADDRRRCSGLSLILIRPMIALGLRRHRRRMPHGIRSAQATTFRKESRIADVGLVFLCEFGFSHGADDGRKAGQAYRVV